jgi:DNA polymerase-3 subunit gamma/tau
VSKIALYRKYRPTTFDELYGQEHIATTLKNSVVGGTFSHAYLFYGPRGTGKTSAARILAKAINCEHNAAGNPDGKCDKCKLIESGKTVDIIEIDAASHTQVDNIREVIIEKANFAPTSLRYKVYIIDEAHMLSKSSFNALLKTLEEPPEHAIFILATTEINKIIPTIQSRCQRFDFRRIDDVSMQERLSFIAKSEKVDIDDKSLAMIVRASEGGFRDAISLLDQASDLGHEKITEAVLASVLGLADFTSVEDYVFALVSKNATAALEIFHKALESGYEPGQFYKNALETMRRLLFASVSGVTEVGLSAASAELFKDALAKTSAPELLSAIDVFIRTDSAYKYSVLLQLSIEIATIKIAMGIGETASAPKQTVSADKVNASAGATEVKKAPKAVNADAKWQNFLMEVKSKNTSIHAVLRVCEPTFDGDVVCLTFPYKFHKERVEDTKNRGLVEDVLTKVYGEKYRVKCILRPGMATEAASPVRAAMSDDLLDEALGIFGGEVSE